MPLGPSTLLQTARFHLFFKDLQVFNLWCFPCVQLPSWDLSLPQKPLGGGFPVRKKLFVPVMISVPSAKDSKIPDREKVGWYHLFWYVLCTIHLVSGFSVTQWFAGSSVWHGLLSLMTGKEKLSECFSKLGHNEVWEILSKCRLKIRSSERGAV